VSAGGGTKAIVAALVANAGIAVAKFIGFLITGSSSMLAESVHSVADTSNQGLLLLGQKTAQRKATRLHPFGFGRDRYFWSFVVALMLFTLGSVFALYEGIHKLQHPEELSSPLVAVGILVVAIGLECYSFYTAIFESKKIKGDATWWQFIRNSRTPELPVVLLEDAGALIGLVLALIGVSLATITGNPVFDALGTIAIGVLLGIIAIILIIEMKSLLIGEGASDKDLDVIIDELAAGRAARGGEDRAGVPVAAGRGGSGDQRRGAAGAGQGAARAPHLPGAGPGPVDGLQLLIFRRTGRFALT
jgi:cation diffusion facilitator family transporter